MRSWISAWDWPRQQALGRGLEHEAQKGERFGIAEHVAEPVAEMHRRSGGGLDRLIDQPRAAEFEEAAVADLGLGRPAQQASRSRPRRNLRSCLRARFQSIRNTRREPRKSR